MMFGGLTVASAYLIYDRVPSSTHHVEETSLQKENEINTQKHS